MVAMYAALTMVRRLLLAFTPTAHVPAASANAAHLVKDPVCGTYVPEANAIQAGGQFFCSELCRKKFERSSR
jgi:YHS domain-containing protein